MLGRVTFVLLFLLSTFPLLAQEQEPAVWRALAQQAYQLHQSGQSEKAVALAETAIRLAEDTGDTLAVGMTSGVLGLIHQEREDYFAAEKLFEKAVEIYESDPRIGPEHEFTAKTYKNRALCLYSLGRHREAEVFFRKALHNYQLLDAGRNHPLTLDIVKGVANTLVEQARYGEAQELYREVIEKSDPESLEAQQARQGLATILSLLGDYKQAEETLLPLVDYFQNTAQPSVKSYERLATVLGSLGGVKVEQGDYKKAEEYYLRALELRKQTSPGRPSVASAMNNLALLYNEIGDRRQAEPLYRQALELHRASLGAEHPLVATSLNNLGLLLAAKGETEQAESLLSQSLEIERKLHGESHPDVARTLSNLGTLYLEGGRPEPALAMFEKAVEIYEKDGGPAYATALSNLGSAYHHLGRLEEAEKAFLKVLDEGNSDNIYTARNNLAYLGIDQEDEKAALQHARAASEVLFQRLQNVFSFTSERQRLDFQRTLNPYGLLTSLDSPGDCFVAALRFKGAVLDSIVEDRRLAQAAQDPELRSILSKVESDKGELLQLELEKEPADAGRLNELRKAVEKGEATLARRLSGFDNQRKQFAVTAEQVRSKIPKNTALVEILFHGYYLGEQRSEKRYSALVVPPEGEIRLVSLGSAEEVRKRIGDYRNLLLGTRSPTRASRVFLSPAQAGKDPAALKNLYDLVWGPVQSVLPADTENLLICPDGELNFVSFATLLDEQGLFLGERYQISYLSSARDLMVGASVSARGKLVVNLFGNPDYGPHDPKINGVVLTALPGTESECRTLEGVLESQAPEVALGVEADEARVRRLTGAQVLHVATHGLFLSETLGPRNPMSRSGLALAGAQTTLDQWALGKASEVEYDGFLTAEEVAGMDLSTTDLVVLSACDTGLGASQNGEGVLGLRRGFVKSGARNLLFTLWPIDDAETAAFMTDFYQAVQRMPTGQALNTTQRAWLSRLKAEEGAVTAARLAGPFVISGTERSERASTE